LEIKKKKIIVTGGANGIGKELVKRLYKKDAVLGVFDYKKKSLDKLKSELPNIQIWRCDVSEYDDVKKCINEFYEKNEQIDVVVNNAGITIDSPLFNIFGMKKHDIESWDKVIKTNLNSVFYVSVNCVEKMIKKRTKGLIINVGSICSDGNAGQTAYSASKAGVQAMTKTWAKELSQLGIRVAGIAPGYTKTDIVKQMNTKVIDDWNKKIPLKRMAEPEEIADGIIFIIKNDYFNGKILQLDGGLII